MSVYYEGAEPPNFPRRHLFIRSLALTLGASAPFLILPIAFGALGFILYTIILGYLFMIIFAQIYYLPESSKPSFVERLRIHKCPYCRHWSSSMVDRRAVGGGMNRSAPEPQGSLTSEQMRGYSVGPEKFLPGTASGMSVEDSRIETVEPEVEMTTFEESFKCSNCGRAWSRDVTQETKMILRPKMKEEVDAEWKNKDV